MAPLENKTTPFAPYSSSKASVHAAAKHGGDEQLMDLSEKDLREIEESPAVKKRTRATRGFFACCFCFLRVSPSLW